MNRQRWCWFEALSEQYNSAVLSFFIHVLAWWWCNYVVYNMYTFVNGIVWYCLVLIPGIAWYSMVDKKVWCQRIIGKECHQLFHLSSLSRPSLSLCGDLEKKRLIQFTMFVFLLPTAKAETGKSSAESHCSGIPDPLSMTTPSHTHTLRTNFFLQTLIRYVIWRHP